MISEPSLHPLLPPYGAFSVMNEPDSTQPVRISFASSNGSPPPGIRKFFYRIHAAFAAILVLGAAAGVFPREPEQSTPGESAPSEMAVQAADTAVHKPDTANTAPLPPGTPPPRASAATGSYDLDKVVVKAGVRRFSRKETDQVSRMPLKNLENPQAYSVVTKELTQEQMAVDYRSAFKNIPGAGPANLATNGRNIFTSRGFSTANLIRNGMASWVYSDVDPISLERVEAIRGPSGALFGSTLVSYGGLFNRVTKKPFDVYKGEVSYSGGPWNLNRFTGDVNLPLNAEKSALLRVNAASHAEQSFQDAGFTRSVAFAPGFFYQANDKLSFSLDAEWYSRKATGIVTSFGPAGIANAKSMDEVGMDPERSFNSNTLTGDFPTFNITGQIDYKLPYGLSSRTQFSSSRMINDERGIWGFASISDNLAVRTYGNGQSDRASQQVQQNFLGDFRIGPVRNRFLVGLDYSTVSTEGSSYSGVLDTVDFLNPGNDYNHSHISYAERKAASFPLTSTNVLSHTYSVYATDVINPIDRVSLLLGLRLDRFDNRGNRNVATGAVTGIYEQDALSPKFGAVFQPVKDRFSLFANYMNGFRNVTGTDFNNNAFDPEQANQWEVGVKSEEFGGKLVATASYYDITVDDLVRPDKDHANFSVQDGRQTSKGVELELAANPVAGLNVIAGYAFNDSKLDKAAANVNGRRPASAGAENAANFWISYRLPRGAVRGLGAGLGANYFGEQFMVNTATQQFTVPEYATWDATVFLDRQAYRLGLKMDNLTDETYWNAWGAPQPPRRVIGSVAYRF